MTGVWTTIPGWQTPGGYVPPYRYRLVPSTPHAPALGAAWEIEFEVSVDGVSMWVPTDVIGAVPPEAAPSERLIRDFIASRQNRIDDLGGMLHR